MLRFVSRLAIVVAGIVVGFAPSPSAAEPTAKPPAQGSVAPPMTAKAARKLMKLPRGSASLGMTNSGRLIAGVEMPLKGRGFAVFPGFVKRQTRWGTAEMIATLKTAAAAVRTEFPKSVLGIGNISKEGGGQTGHSVSHKSGRDADIAMFAYNKRGRRINLMNFIKFREDGWDAKRRYRFDAERNFALVKALVQNPKAPIQFIFCARWLKKRMMEVADKRGVNPELRRRLDEVLRMPSDSNPHQDHFHVRVYCSVQDRLHGCLERGPIRDWVDLGDDALSAHAAKLAQAVSLDDATVRRQALGKLGKIRAISAIDTVIKALLHPDDRTRRAALLALERMGTSIAIPGLLHALQQTTDAKWASELIEAVRKVAGRAAADIAVALLMDPASILHPSWASGPPGPVQERAVKILARFGRDSALVPLIAIVKAAPTSLRRLAHTALRKVTNQPFKARARTPDQLDRVAALWKLFAAKHGSKGWTEWQRLGFVERGIALPKILTKAVVPRLIKAIGAADKIVSDNAVWLLSQLTDHPQDPRWRSKRNNQRHWTSWWRDNKHLLPAVLPPPAPEPPTVPAGPQPGAVSPVNVQPKASP